MNRLVAHFGVLKTHYKNIGYVIDFQGIVSSIPRQNVFPIKIIGNSQ